MCFESSLWHSPQLLVLINPLILHFGLEVLADFKVLYRLHEHSLDQYLVDVLEVNSMNSALISLDFIVAQNPEDVSVLDQYLLLLVNKERVLVVHEVLCLLEFGCIEFAGLIELWTSEWRRKLNHETNEVEHINPTCSLGIILLPSLNERVHIVAFDHS